MYSLTKSISLLSFPKKLVDLTAEHSIISNISSEKTQIQDAQYFIDMDIEGHLLGIAWLLVVGYKFEENIYEHSYGNRLRKNLVDEITKLPSFSPYLFEPYFQQYESWRDTALSYAKKSLNKNQDIILLTLDFKRFFYQVNISHEHLTKIVDDFQNDEKCKVCDIYMELINPLTSFIWEVIHSYSLLLKHENEYLVEERNILPIGFFPSNVLANYCLKKFDDTIIDGWNPIYYGRYVDDIIIVDKIEKNSKIYRDAKNGTLTIHQAINHFLLNCNAWRKSDSPCDFNQLIGLLSVSKKFTDIEIKKIKKHQKNKELSDDEKKKCTVYIVNQDYNEFPGSEIIVQNGKVKIFYFSSAQSDALLTCFQENLRENKSEFRFLPEDESIFQKNDYTEIYNLIEKDGPNKLRGVGSIDLDKFKLSKFLGKYMRISGLIVDKSESQFDLDIEKIFTYPEIIDNYITWEKVIEILINNRNLKAVENFIIKITKAIINIFYCENTSGNINCMKNTLLLVLTSAVNKSMSILWGPDVENSINIITKVLNKTDELIDWEDSSRETIKEMRKNYCITRMCDKYALPILIDGFIENDKLTLNDNIATNLTSLSDALLANYRYDCLERESYIYYPYLITMNDLAIYNVLKDIYFSTDQFNENTINKLKYLYTHLNYQVHIEERDIQPPLEAKPFKNTKHLMIKVGEDRHTNIRIAVANTVLSDDFESVLGDTPNRTYTRYQQVVKLINAAIENKSDFLVMPENYLPLEWLPILARTCAKNQMALVTGIEHVKIRDMDGTNVVCNLTAVILPYVEENLKSSYIHFHTKNHFAPHERIAIESYRCKVWEGYKHYELFNWSDFWFTVYCCYELTSILDRAIFQSYADAVVAVEWNKDTNYYSNIVESLARDLHCFCIQVNTAKYGDSRITQPSKTEERDILKVKGGINPTVLIENIEISGLRGFQLKGNALQEKSLKTYKPTPPDFNYDVVRNKILGILWS